MSIGFSIAIAAIPFLDLLDREEASLAAKVLEAGDDSAVALAMEQSRRRLAQGVDAFVRSLPSLIRSDTNTARSASYALVGLVDERMLHHPSGGLDRWRDRLLEFELYDSGLAGQEIITRARAAAYSSGASPGSDADITGEALLAPLYLGVLRAGFEGSLRGDTLGLISLICSLEESIGVDRRREVRIATDTRPERFGVSPAGMAALGLGAWLLSGLLVWATLPRQPLDLAARIAQRITADLPILQEPIEPLQRSFGPSNLPAPDPQRPESIR